MKRRALFCNETVLLIGSKPEHDAQIEQACTELREWAKKDGKDQLSFLTEEIEVVSSRTDVDIAAVVGGAMYRWRNGV